MCVAAAIAGVASAAIGAAGTAYAGHQAAQATKSATNAAINQQNQALQSQQQLSAPYRSLGQQAIPTLEALLGLKPGGAAAAQTTLQNMPGYQFTKQQGIQGTTNAASAMGLGLSGNTLQGIDKFTTGLADQNYQQYVGNLQNAVGLGQAAAAGQAANVGNAAGNISNALINQGQVSAGIGANTIAGLTKSIGSGIDAYTLNNTLAGLQNPGGGGGLNLTPPSQYGGTWADANTSALASQGIDI